MKIKVRCDQIRCASEIVIAYISHELEYVLPSTKISQRILHKKEETQEKNIVEMIT